MCIRDSMYSDQEINAFFNNVGSYVGNDMYHKYEEDIKLLKSLKDVYKRQVWRPARHWARRALFLFQLKQRVLIDVYKRQACACRRGPSGTAARRCAPKYEYNIPDYEYDVPDDGLSGGEYWCMGKGDTCQNKTYSAYDFYCLSLIHI